MDETLQCEAYEEWSGRRLVGILFDIAQVTAKKSRHEDQEHTWSRRKDGAWGICRPCACPQ